MTDVILKFSNLTMKEFMRDFVSAFFTLAFPMFFLVVFGSSSSLRSAPSLKLAVIDDANSVISQQLVSNLAEEDLNNLVFTTLTEANTQLEAGNLHGILQVVNHPDGTPRINVTQRGYDNPVVNQTIAVAIYKLYPAAEAELLLEQMSVDILQTSKNSDFAYVMPGILGMALLQLGLFGTATPILAARNRGTLLQLSMTPLPAYAVVLSHVLVRMLLAVIQLILMLAVSIGFFDLTINGDPLLLTLSCALGAFMLISIGFFIGGIAPVWRPATTSSCLPTWRFCSSVMCFMTPRQWGCWIRLPKPCL